MIWPSSRELKREFVAQRDRLQHGHDLVITVGSLTENAQVPVDFGEGRKLERGLGQRVMKV